MPHIDSLLPCRSLLRSTRTPLVADIVLFLYPRTRASTAVVSRYTAIVMCAFAHFHCRSLLRSTRTPPVAVIVLFYVYAPVQARRWASCYIAIVMCAFAHFHCHSLLRSTRTPLIAVIVLFLCPRTRASTVVGIKKNTLTSESVRVGRSYRNRTYTVGVRGPSATTTPSSIALIIIYQRIAI